MKIFITGGTGYIGTRLIASLITDGLGVTALVRSASLAKLPTGCEFVVGDALDADSYQKLIAGADTFVHLVGVPNPSPLKAELFRRVDLVSLKAAVQAATSAQIDHFVYVSIAHPAPVMKAYVAVRQECEQLIRDSGLNATILRPWYVLGPGHWWPYALIPLYKIFERFPPTAETCKRLGLVRIDEMVRALHFSTRNAPRGIRVLDVATIREIASMKLS